MEAMAATAARVVTSPCRVHRAPMAAAAVTAEPAGRPVGPVSMVRAVMVVMAETAVRV
jgi:hypothetical protein